MDNILPDLDQEMRIANLFTKKKVSALPSAEHPLKTSQLDKIDQPVAKKLHLKKWQKALILAFSLFLIIVTSVASYTVLVAQEIKHKATQALPLVNELKTLLATQNLMLLPDKVTQLQSAKEDLKTSYQKLAFYSKIPLLSAYYADGQILLEAADLGLNTAQKSMTALLPYADLLGFQGEGSFTGGTTQDRIVLILETLKEIQPTIDQIEQDIHRLATLLEQINPARYPQKLAQHELRAKILEVQKTAQLASQAFSDYKPVVASLAKMAGADEAQKYLVLFQNDNELRPTGGFLTAYAIITVDKGVVNSEKSDDIYELDQKFSKRIAIPEVLGKYLTTEKYFHLRDMNISPDFKIAMQQFYENYLTVKGEPKDIDGIIAVDTHVLSELLRVIGPVEAPGYGTFSAENDIRCDCPQVVYALSEIITKPTPYMREDRKGVLGPLMKAVLAKTFDLDKARFPELFSVAMNSIEGRHLQMYFMDENSQLATQQINAAGRLFELKDNLKGWQMGNNMDFLAIVDANLGGAKSNLFTNYELKQSIEAPVDGRLKKTLEITYKNNRKADNCNLEAGKLCLNATLNDWLRIYVPKGAELIEIQGISNQASVYDEENLTVIDGYFSLEPMGLAKIKLSYTIPYTDPVNYNLRMWKQGGIEAVPVLIDVTGGEEQLLLNKDLDYSSTF